MVSLHKPHTRIARACSSRNRHECSRRADCLDLAFTANSHSVECRSASGAPPASRRTSGMPGFNCRPESPEQSGKTAFSLALDARAPPAARLVRRYAVCSRVASDCDERARPCRTECRRTGGTRALADGGGDRTAFRLSDHELHGRPSTPRSSARWRSWRSGAVAGYELTSPSSLATMIARHTRNVLGMPY